MNRPSRASSCCSLSSFDFPLALESQLQIASRRLLSLLDKGMQQNHLSCMLAEQHASDTALRQRAANLPQSPAQGTAQRHANGPGKLDILDIFANDLAIFR